MTISHQPDWSYLTDWKLKAGSHKFPGPDGGTCINEAAIIAAGFEYKSVGSFHDLPPCFSPVLGQWLITGNDVTPDMLRQALMPFVHKLAGTWHGEQVERQRLALLVGIVGSWSPADDYYRVRKDCAIPINHPSAIHWSGFPPFMNVPRRGNTQVSSYLDIIPESIAVQHDREFLIAAEQKHTILALLERNYSLKGHFLQYSAELILAVTEIHRVLEYHYPDYAERLQATLRIANALYAIGPSPSEIVPWAANAALNKARCSAKNHKEPA